MRLHLVSKTRCKPWAPCDEHVPYALNSEKLMMGDTAFFPPWASAPWCLAPAPKGLRKCRAPIFPPEKRMQTEKSQKRTRSTSVARPASAPGKSAAQKKKKPQRKPKLPAGPPPAKVAHKAQLDQLTALVRATKVKTRHAQIAVDQLVNPATSPLLRIQAGGGSSTLIRSALARLPTRLHLDLATVLSAASIPGGVPYFGLGDEAYPVWSATSSNDKYYQFVLTDDPVVPLIYPVLSSQTDKIYNLTAWIAGTQDKDGTITVLRNGGVANADSPFSIPLGGNTWTNKDGGYGDTHPIGCNSDGVYYTWLDANSEYPTNVYLVGQFAFPAGVTVKQVRVSASVLTGSTDTGAGRFVQVTASAVSTPASLATYSANVTLAYSGYYAFTITGLVDWPTSGERQTVVFNPIVTGLTATRFEYQVGMVSRHITNSHLTEVAEGGAVAAARVLGSSGLFTNVAPNLYKGGSSLCYSAAVNSDFWFTKVTDILGIEQVDEQFYQRAAWEKGVYAYVRPRAYGKIVELKHERGSRSTFNGDFADPWGWTAVMLQPSLGSATSAPMMVQLFTALEFWTENPMFHLEAPEMSVEAYNIFVDTCTKLGKPFSCNPNHFQLIFEAIKAAARTAGHVLMPAFETGVRFTKALQSETPFSSALAELGA